MHEPLPGLFDSASKAYVGSPLRPLALASVAAVGAAGRGAVQTLINSTPDTDKHGDSQKLGRVPIVITATVYGVGGGATGPLVGIAEWGSGNGVQQSVEFDIPLMGVGAGAAAAGGAILSVPCTAITIKARNDGNVIPRNGDLPIGSIFGPVASETFPAAACSVGTGVKAGNAFLTRTIWAVNGGAGLAATGSVSVSVPAWAQRFRVLRSDAGQTIQVTTSTLGFQGVSGPINEAANAPPTLYALPSGANAVQITNTGAAAINFIAVLFELGL